MSEPTASNYLKYLPSIHQKPEEPALGQFLLPFEEVFSEIEHLLSGIDHYFDPANTPERFLEWLASWVALELDDKWDEAKKRDQIAKAIDLYRMHGTVAGLKKAIEIYDPDLRVDVIEQSMPGGMQIGVASRIGSLEAAPSFGVPSPEVKILRVERQEPAFYDYYLVDTVQPHNSCQRCHPAEEQVADSEPIHIYYRADQVASISKHPSVLAHPPTFPIEQDFAKELDKGELASERLRQEFLRKGRPLTECALVIVHEKNSNWKVVDGVSTYQVLRNDQTLKVVDLREAVELTLGSGETCNFSPASIKRLRRIPETKYSLTDSSGRAAEFVGDTLLVEHLEQPYQFVVDIGIPTGWLRLSNTETEFKLDKWFTDNSMCKAIGHLLRDDGGVTRIEECVQGQAWMVDTHKRTGIWVQRIGWALYVYNELDCTFGFPMVWLKADTDLDRKAVDCTIREVFRQTHRKDIILPDRDIELDFEPLSCRWIKFELLSLQNSKIPRKTREFLVMRDGSKLKAYERVEDEKWNGIKRLYEKTPGTIDCTNRSDLPGGEVIRAIHSIVDEIKPAHTQYALRVRPVLDLELPKPMRLGVDTDRMMIGMNMIIG